MYNKENGKKALFAKIQKLDFVLKETILFLDTHPNNRKALAYFDKKRDELSMYMSEYEENYGPITALATDTAKGWQWVQGAWPWENKEKCENCNGCTLCKKEEIE